MFQPGTVGSTDECFSNLPDYVHALSGAWIGDRPSQRFGMHTTPLFLSFSTGKYPFFSCSSMLISERLPRWSSHFFWCSRIFRMASQKRYPYQVSPILAPYLHTDEEPQCLRSCSYCSGIMAILFCGITMSQYTQQNISPVTQITFRQTFRTISFVAGAWFLL